MNNDRLKRIVFFCLNILVAFSTLSYAQNFSFLKNLPCPDIGLKREALDVEAVKKTAALFKGKPKDFTAHCRYEGGSSFSAYFSEAHDEKEHLCNIPWYKNLVEGRDAYEPSGALKAEYQGFGMELSKKTEDDFVYVVNIFGGGMAEKAGIETGDKIYGIKDRPVKGLTLQEAVELSKVEQGKVVIFDVYKEKSKIRRKISAVYDTFIPDYSFFEIASPTHFVHIRTTFPTNPDTFAQDKQFYLNKAIEFAQTIEGLAVQCRALEVSDKGPVAE